MNILANITKGVLDSESKTPTKPLPLGMGIIQVVCN